MTLRTDLQYISSIIWYKISINFSNLEFEQYEQWQKTSFRNRCHILGANGIITLSVPISGGRNVKALTKEIRIDNRQNWQSIHWRSIVSAYNRSPWFEYYRPELEMKFSKPYAFLWDWNLEWFYWVSSKMGWNPKISFSSHYSGADEIENIHDIRGRITPKYIQNLRWEGPEYSQVFQDRMGFIPNLSIIDLLFAEGKNTLNFLKQDPQILVLP